MIHITRIASILSTFILSASVFGQLVMHRFDVTTGWESPFDLSIDKSDYKEGTGSMLANATAGNNSLFSKTFSSTNTGIDETGYLIFWLYVSDASKLEGGEIEISSSGNSDDQESNWAFDKNSLSNGWNKMELQISQANKVAGGADLKKINYFNIHQDISDPITVKIDFLRFAPSTEKPVWPVLNVPEIDFTTLDGKVMIGYQGWFTHPDDGSNLDWFHWGTSYEPFLSSVDMYPDMREYGFDEKYPTHYSFPDGSMAPVFSSQNEQTVLRHIKWMRDYNIDGLFLQRFISQYDQNLHMAAKDTVALHVMHGAEKYGRAFVMMYDGVAGRVEEMKADWMHLVDDLKITSSPNYLHHNGLPLVSMWGYSTRDDATVGELEEMIEFFTNNPEPKYRAAIKLGVSGSWNLSQKQQFHASFKKVDVISPWWSGTSNYETGQQWCDENGLTFMPVAHPGFSWYNLRKNFEQNNAAPDVNSTPREGGRFFWSELNMLVEANARTVYLGMFDEVDESTCFFKTSENKDDTPQEGVWVPLDIDGYDLPSDWYLRLANRANMMVKGYEDNLRPDQAVVLPPEGIMTIRISDEINDGDNGSMEFIFPDFPNESTIEISLDGGSSFPYTTNDNAGTYTISNLNEGYYEVYVRHNSSSEMVDMGMVQIANRELNIPEQAFNPYPPNGAVGVRTGSVIGWSTGKFTVKNKIYLGTSNNPDSIAFQSRNSYKPEDLLEPNTTYYWSIEERNSMGSTVGEVWSFTTGDDNEPEDAIHIDYADQVGDWTSQDNIVLDTTNNPEGYASLSVIGTTTDKLKIVFNEPINTYSDTNSFFAMWLYISDTSLISGSGQIEVSSGGTFDNNEYAWNIPNLNLENGWNDLRLAIKDAEKVGEPDLSAINYIRIYQFVSAEAEFKFDFLRFTGLASTPLEAPKDFKGEPGGNAALLSWTPLEEESVAGYNIYAGISGSLLKKINDEPIPANSYNDSSVIFLFEYDYQIAAVDTLGFEGKLSEIITVQPNPPVSVDFKEVVGAEIKVFPNPIQSLGNVVLDLDRSANVQVSIFDISGKELRRLSQSQVMPAGEYRMVFYKDDLPKGAYLLKVGIDKQYLSETIIIE